MKNNKQKNRQSTASSQVTETVRERITLGNVSGTGIAIGRNASATVIQSNIEIDVIGETFGQLYKALETIPAASTQKEIAQQIVQKLEQEARKDDQVDESKVAEWFQMLVTILPDVAQVAIATFINPIQGLSVAFQKIAQKAQDNLANATG